MLICRAQALALFVCLIAAVAPASAQTPFTHAGFGGGFPTYSPAPDEHVDPASGTLVMTATDLVLPGNAGLDLAVVRVYNSGVFPDFDAGGSTAIEEDSWAGIGWRLHFGRVLQPNATVPGETQIEWGDGSRHSLYTTTARPEGWTTKGFWVYDRSTHTLKLPSGLLYTFGHVVTLNARLGEVRYVTEIRDVYNNRLTFSYFSAPGPLDGIAEIRQHLGGGQERVVTFTYDAVHKGLATMQYLDRVWTYEQVAAGPPGHSVLTRATPPRGPGRRYEYTSGFPGELTVAHTPSSGRSDYTYATAVRRAGPNSTTARVVTQRTPSGYLVAPGTWTFSYGAGSNQDTTVVASPCGTTKYRFLGTGLTGDFSGWSAGALAEQWIEQGGDVLERQTFTYLKSQAVSPDQVMGEEGAWTDADVYTALPQGHTITRGTQSWTTTHEYHTTSFNDYGRPYRTVESGELTRTTTRTFQGGFTPYLLPQIVSEQVTVGSQTVTSAVTYDLATGFVTGRTGRGPPATFEATATGNVGASIDGRGNRTTFQYTWGAVQTVTTPHTVTSMGINEDGTTASVHPGDQLLTRYDYDRGRLFRVRPHGPHPTVYEYHDVDGAWVRTTRGTASTQATLDGFGRVRSTVNQVGLRTRTDLDACGRAVFTAWTYSSGAGEEGVTTQYDGLGRITRASDSAGQVTTTAYTGIDVTRTDAASRQTTFNYSAFGSPAAARLVSVQDAAGVTTPYTYDISEQLATAKVPGTTLTRTWTYNALGQLTQDTQPEAGTTTHTYDAAGNVLTTTDATSTQVTRTYDASNRVTLLNYPGTADDVTLTYDSVGRVASQSRSGASTSSTYDALTGHLLTKTDVVGSLTYTSQYTYDLYDNVATITYPSGRVIAYLYDAEQRLTEVRQNGQVFAHSVTYDGRGRLASYRTGAVTHAVAYDEAQRVSRITAGGGLDLTYGYDVVGNVTGIADPRPGYSQWFAVDALDRLTWAATPYSSISWTYDPAGNRLTESAGGLTTYSYQASTQRLTSISGAASETYTYDAVGRLTQDSRGQYAYKPTGLLASVTAPSVAASYAYDPGGLRVTRTVNSETT